MRTKESLEQYIDEINENPTWFLGIRNWWLRRKINYSVQRTEDVSAFIAAKDRLAELEWRVQEAERERSRKGHLAKATFELQMEMAICAKEAERCRVELLEAATSLGMTVEDMSAVNKQKALVGIKVSEHRQMKQIDYEHEEQLTQLKLKAAFAYKMGSLDYANRVLGMLQDFRRERYHLQYSGQPLFLIQEQLLDFDRHIAALEVQHARLLQGDNGQELRRGDENTVSRRLAKSHLGAGEE